MIGRYRRYQRDRRARAALRSGVLGYAGQSIYFPPGGTHVAGVLLASGEYEASSTVAFQEAIRPDTTVLDVGANIGVSALQILAMHRDIRVVSFEASPTVQPYLSRTHAACPARDRWQLVSKAVSDTKGCITNFHVNPHGYDALDGLKNTNRVTGGWSIEVETTTLDYEWQALGKPIISLVKIDVEGAESLVLTGAASMIAACRPVIVTEWYEKNFSAYGVRPEWVLLFAKSCKYHVYVMPEIIPADPVAFRFQLAGRDTLLLIPDEESPTRLQQT